MTIEISTKETPSIILSYIKNENDEYDFKYDDKVWLKAKVVGHSFIIIKKDELITNSDSDLLDQLNELYLDIIESEQSGTENTETKDEEAPSPFDPEKIKVHAKPFSLRLISDMIDDKDIDLSPDFQRHFVWNNLQKSRLIESILLRIPLPMFYFSEDNEGKIIIIDGLQRLTTIKEFMDNKFPLRNLEYLQESCGGKFFKADGKKEGIDLKYMRWFNQTQFSVNVIDSSSPAKVKFDIFRRINTGGKPLNSQEIRNCLAGANLRDTINEMISLPEFKSATDNSIRSTRMEDQELALRFMLFVRLMESENEIEDYNGYMDSSLDDTTEELSKQPKNELNKFIDLFSSAMKNSEYLLGSKYAFRKIREKDLQPDAHKKLINKSLFVSISVLLSKYDPAVIQEKVAEKSLLKPLAEMITTDQTLFSYLSFGTNGKSNVIFVFTKIKELIEKIIQN